MEYKGQTPEELLESKTVIGQVDEDIAYDAVDLAKREIAWNVHSMICHGATIADIDKYVTDICDF